MTSRSIEPTSFQLKEDIIHIEVCGVDKGTGETILGYLSKLDMQNDPDRLRSAGYIWGSGSEQITDCGILEHVAAKEIVSHLWSLGRCMSSWLVLAS